MVTDDVFCAFMVDDPDGIGKENNGHANKEIDGLSRSFSFFLLPSKLICVSIMPCMAKGKRKGRRVHIPIQTQAFTGAQIQHVCVCVCALEENWTNRYSG